MQIICTLHDFSYTRIACMNVYVKSDFHSWKYHKILWPGKKLQRNHHTHDKDTNYFMTLN